MKYTAMVPGSEPVDFEAAGIENAVAAAADLSLAAVGSVTVWLGNLLVGVVTTGVTEPVVQPLHYKAEIASRTKLVQACKGKKVGKRSSVLFVYVD